MSSSHLRLCLPIGLCASGFLTKTFYMHFSSLPFVLHVPPISTLLLLLLEYYFTKSKRYEAPYCVIFSITLLRLS